MKKKADPSNGKKHWNYHRTAERMLEFHPQRAELGIKLLAEGWRPHQVAKKIQADIRTVHALEFQKKTSIEEMRQRMMGLAYKGSVMTLEHAIENLQDMSAYQAAGMHGIMRDTWMHLNAIPNVRTEVTHKIDFVGELQKIKDELREKAEEMKKVYGRVIPPPELPEA